MSTPLDRPPTANGSPAPARQLATFDRKVNPALTKDVLAASDIVSPVWLELERKAHARVSAESRK
ncbi:hypothetical protein [Mesorhizobium sp. WSM3860]|uniref:hypothetical protein n=1 Tax=Mesorhizobium sp. WSM3860 TaxID=2029403 RepID=UPI0011409F5E|nr:hypothetical protein [Mesorhizobium sp. WSM3860]